MGCKACFPLGECVRANREKSNLVDDITSHYILLVRAKKSPSRKGALFAILADTLVTAGLVRQGFNQTRDEWSKLAYGFGNSLLALERRDVVVIIMHFMNVRYVDIISLTTLLTTRNVRSVLHSCDTIL